MSHVFIIVLNYNGRENTINCLKSLEGIDKASFKLTVVVVDNASSENLESEKDFSFSFPLTIIRNKTNLGYSGGNNAGIEYALKNKADYVTILNNDTIVSSDFIKEFLIIAKKNPKIGILVPKIYFAKGFEFHKTRYRKNELGKVFWYAGGEMDWENVIGHHRGVDEVDHGQYDVLSETDYATGCCMMIGKEIFQKVGMLDDRYYLYYEDSDLSTRVKKAGYKIVYVPKSIIFHKNAGSVGGSGSSLQDYYITRNRLIFGMRYASLRAKFALLRESLKILLNGRYWQKRGALDYYTGRLGKGSYKL